MTVAIILLCIALIIVTAPASWPLSPSSAAFVLALRALIMVATGWGGPFK